MARSWVSGALLPPTFWWFAFKRAIEVSNYVPLKISGKLTIPHELVYGSKPNLQNILPMFSVCYIRRRKSDENTNTKNVKNHSLAVIIVGRSTVANSPLFFHPHTKRLITADDYFVDDTIVTGPAFDIASAICIHFNSYSEQNIYLQPPTFKPEQTVFVKLDGIHHKASNITLPTRDQHIYIYIYIYILSN